MASSFPDAAADKKATPDLISVAKFAEQYRVDPSIVRGWIRMGYINYVLDGAGRQMRRIRVSDAVKPLVDPPPVTDNNDPEASDGRTAGAGSGLDGGETQGAEADSGGTGRSEAVPQVAGRVGGTTGSAPAPPVDRQRKGHHRHR